MRVLCEKWHVLSNDLDMLTSCNMFITLAVRHLNNYNQMVTSDNTWSTFIIHGMFISKIKDPLPSPFINIPRPTRKNFLYISHMSHISPDSDVIKNSNKLF